MLPGRHKSSIIRNCYSTGNVTSSGGYSAGGITGRNSGNVENCYASGIITSTGGAGAEVGSVDGASTGTVRCVGLSSKVISSQASTVVGRVVGKISSGGSGGGVSNNYGRNDMQVYYNTSALKTISSGLNTNDGQDVSAGTSPGQYNDQYFWETTLGWDFTNDWIMSGGPNSLPVLR